MGSYYVLLRNGEPRAVAKLDGNANSYLWKNGKWEYEPYISYMIRNEIHDFVEISEKEANVYIKQMEKKAAGQ